MNNEDRVDYLLKIYEDFINRLKDCKVDDLSTLIVDEEGKLLKLQNEVLKDE